MKILANNLLQSCSLNLQNSLLIIILLLDKSQEGKRRNNQGKKEGKRESHPFIMQADSSNFNKS